VSASGLLVDLDGTLYVGDEPIPGAVEALERITARGIPFRCVTNTTRKNRRQVAGALREMGFRLPGSEGSAIFTPAMAANQLLEGRRVHALVAEPLLEDLSGVEILDTGADVVLVGDLGRGFDYGRLNAAFRLLVDGADLVALQRNRFWREPDGFSLDAGAFVAALEYASGKAATVVGKPERTFFEMALRDLGLPAGRVAAVGDDPEADVVGAKRAGLLGVQVRTGKYEAVGEVAEADLVLDSFTDLPGALGL
jgi:HAD superfamily hydrolase (TIGR01458 family)